MAHSIYSAGHYSIKASLLVVFLLLCCAKIKAMDYEKKHPIIVAYASVGSGHKVAAKSVKKALDKMLDAGGLPSKFADTRTQSIDILDYFMKKIDGNNTVSIYTGLFAPIYDFT